MEIRQKKGKIIQKIQKNKNKIKIAPGYNIYRISLTSITTNKKWLVKTNRKQSPIPKLIRQKKFFSGKNLTDMVERRKLGL